LAAKPRRKRSRIGQTTQLLVDTANRDPRTKVHYHCRGRAS
jgi:hypothetical protein